MNVERFPADLVVTREDFLESGWREVLEESQPEDYSSMWHALSDAARSAIEDGLQKRGKVLWLLADACSMMLVPQHRNDPFKPFAVFHDRRSVIPDDFTESDIDFFADIIDSVDDVLLKARLADLSWLLKKPRDVRHALLAIDSYRSIALHTETWVREGRECWERAVSLTLMIGSGAGERLGLIEGQVLNAFSSASKEDGYLCLWLADLLRANGLGREHGLNIAKKLEDIALEFDEEGELNRSREYFSAASEWYRIAGNDDKAVEMIVAVAEGWAKEAAYRASTDTPSHMVAASFYENAIQTYRTIPRSKRPTYRVDERIVELRAYLNDAGEKSLGEMGVISIPGIDLSELMENARKSVSGKTVSEALCAFANLTSGPRVSDLKKSALEKIGKFPLQSLFSATMMSRDGRVVAKRPAMGFGAESSPENEISILADMVRDFGFFVNIAVVGEIIPALEVIIREHRLREADFVGLAHRSPLVPKDRANLFGKALYAGYDQDFVSALHLLIPQIEHMVRVHLKQAGATTTNLDKDGIENENGLSTLLDLPEAERVFGENLVFEFKSLFTDPFGPNLRNELAHGLLDQDSCYSYFSIYAWWLGLRLVFNTWWNTAHGGSDAGEDGERADG